MKIIDLLNKDAIALNQTYETKEEVFDALIALLSDAITDKETFKKDIEKREAEGVTALVNGICIPHAKSAAVKTPSIAVITVPSGVETSSMDGNLSNLFFMIGVPEDGPDLHLEALAKLTGLLVEENFRTQLLEAKDAEEFLAAVNANEIGKYSEKAAASSEYQVLAVTACPTGIAHTYMAAEVLEKAAEGLNVTIKVETDGAMGPKNVLTKEEIAGCDGIIVAADHEIDMERFLGRPVVLTTTADAIQNANALVQKVLNKETVLFDGSQKAESEGNLGSQIIQSVLNLFNFRNR